MARSIALLRARLLPSRAGSADSVLIREGRIAAVDVAERIERALPPDAERIDVAGRVLVPGFQDAHFHFLQYGRTLARTSLAACASRAELREAIADAARARREPGVLFFEGFDESSWAKPELPTRADLDAIDRERPIVVRRVCGHFAVANGPALALLAERWSRDGIAPATGHVVEEPALELDELFPANGAETRAALAAAGAACLALGITTASDFLRPRGLEAYAGSLPRGELPLRITAWVLPDCLAPDGSVRGDPGASDRFLVRGLKLFLDGTIGGRTAAMFDAYTDRPGERGRLLHARAELRELVQRMHRVGRPVALHAIGDRAIAEALDVFEELPPEENVARGHRVEHVELPRVADRARLAQLGVRPCVQPNFLRWAQPGGLYETALGPERLRAMNPFRSLLDEGSRPFFGSDGMPASPSLGIRYALEHPVASERLTRDDAVRLYTSEAATPGRAARGRLEVGEPADLAVLADFPERLAPPGTADLTLLDGQVVQRAALEAPRAPC